jgi:hypothetical protein
MGWKYGFPGDVDSYKSRKRSQAERDAEREAEQARMMEMLEQALKKDREYTDIKIAQAVQ